MTSDAMRRLTRPTSVVGALVTGSVEKVAMTTCTILPFTTKANDLCNLGNEEYHDSFRSYGVTIGQMPESQRHGHFVPLPTRFTNLRRTSQESYALRSFSSAAVHDHHDHDNDAIPFLLADIGEGIAEVELLQWFVQEGDHVQQFDRICEVQSDKATVEITSRYDGQIIRLDHDRGGMIKVGSPLLHLKESTSSTDMEYGAKAGTSSSSSTLYTLPTKTESQADDEKLHIPTIASQFHLPSDGVGGTTTPAGGETKIQDPTNRSTKVSTSPAIRKLAMEHSLDLSTIVGTGPKQRVLKGDVLTVLHERGLVSPPSSRRKDESPATTTTTSPPSPQSKTIPSSPSSTPSVVTSLDQAVLPLEQDTALELRGYNRLMVQSMTASLQIPHMVYSDEIDVTSLRTRYKAELPFLPYCIKALSMSLCKYPLVNASFVVDSSSSSSGEEKKKNNGGGSNHIMLWADHNIGIAMDTPRGLIVPVIHQVQKKSLLEIVADLQRLKDCAKEGSFATHDLQGATITFSNIGAIGGTGGTYMSPIVNPPQVAIGAMGRIQRLPRFVSEDSMDVQESYIVNISWGGDHRVIDGATMARFHKEWKNYLQNPIGMIKSMK